MPVKKVRIPRKRTFEFMGRTYRLPKGMSEKRAKARIIQHHLRYQIAKGLFKVADRLPPSVFAHLLNLFALQIGSPRARRERYGKPVIEFAEMGYGPGVLAGRFDAETGKIRLSKSVLEALAMEKKGKYAIRWIRDMMRDAMAEAELKFKRGEIDEEVYKAVKSDYEKYESLYQAIREKRAEKSMKKIIQHEKQHRKIAIRYGPRPLRSVLRGWRGIVNEEIAAHLFADPEAFKTVEGVQKIADAMLESFAMSPAEVDVMSDKALKYIAERMFLAHKMLRKGKKPTDVIKRLLYR